MTWQEFIGRMLGIENVSYVDGVGVSFAAPWARGTGATWVLFGCLALIALAAWYYARLQKRTSFATRLFLTLARAIVLTIVFVLIAEPILKIELSNRPRPLLWVLFDGTDSMGIRDEMPEADRTSLAVAVDLPKPEKPTTPAPQKDASATAADESVKPARIDYVKAMLRQEGEKNLLRTLQETYRVRTFVLEQGDGVRPLDAGASFSETVDPLKVADQLTTTGQTTALGNAFDDLAMRHSNSQLAGVVVVSDFGNNAGVSPAGGDDSPARRIGRPIYTIGVGPASAIDLAVELQSPLVMKKNESETLTVSLRQSGLDQRPVSVRLTAQRLPTGDGQSPGAPIEVGRKDLTLDGPSATTTFSFKPPETGRFEFAAEVSPEEGEVVTQNNRAIREVNVRDDFLRLMYVENEPSWEWRFVKEVFHRDKLVGMRGFRTYLNSADPKVRQTNELFLPNLTPRRGDFFANDVLFLGDMPGQKIQSSERFTEMTREFVSKFGGGLVVIAGLRFGPGQLAEGPLADMLPVIPDPRQSKPRTDREFQPKLTANASQFDFMRLGGESEAENQKAWNNMGKLPWYQPVLRVHPQAVVLLEHPTDLCADGKTKQPLIAVRPYGKGEVVYIAFNELWRLRRKYGELYYRQFWGQLIHRLGLSHAIGAQKRFVVRTDRDQYLADEVVTATVEAYNENYEPLTADKLSDKRLQGELIVPGRTEGTTATQPIGLSQLREGTFEAKFPVSNGGEYRLRVIDPITKEVAEIRFAVTGLSAERRSRGTKSRFGTTVGRGYGRKEFRPADDAGPSGRDRSPDRVDQKRADFPARQHMVVLRSGGRTVGLRMGRAKNRESPLKPRFRVTIFAEIAS
ncbi:MAG: hypothetical protein QM811_13620 [Pirellulales bacterium]